MKTDEVAFRPIYLVKERDGKEKHSRTLSVKKEGTQHAYQWANTLYQFPTSSP